MFYIPLLIVCSLSSPELPCMRFHDAIETPYYTQKACQERLQQIYNEVVFRKQQIENALPGPYSFRPVCTVPRSDTFSLAQEETIDEHFSQN